MLIYICVGGGAGALGCYEGLFVRDDFCSTGLQIIQEIKNAATNGRTRINKGAVYWERSRNWWCCNVKSNDVHVAESSLFKSMDKGSWHDGIKYWPTVSQVSPLLQHVVEQTTAFIALHIPSLPNLRFVWGTVTRADLKSTMISHTDQVFSGDVIATVQLSGNATLTMSARKQPSIPIRLSPGTMYTISGYARDRAKHNITLTAKDIETAVDNERWAITMRFYQDQDMDRDDVYVSGGTKNI